MGRINTVIFDIGGVLVDFHPMEGMKEMGFSKDAISAFQDKIFSGVWEMCDQFPYEDEEIRNLFKEKVPEYEKEVDIMWDNLHPISSAYDYSVPWLKELKEQGYKIYILSNFGKRAFEINSAIYPFLNYIDGKVVSYEYQVIKPSAKIYDILINKYQIVPEEAVFIDDRYINIEGAKACGLHAILFENYEQAKNELNLLLN